MIKVLLYVYTALFFCLNISKLFALLAAAQQLVRSNNNQKLVISKCINANVQNVQNVSDDAYTVITPNFLTV